MRQWESVDMFVKLTIEPLIGGLIPIETGRSVEKYIILSPIEPLIGGLIQTYVILYYESGFFY